MIRTLRNRAGAIRSGSTFIPRFLSGCCLAAILPLVSFSPSYSQGPALDSVVAGVIIPVAITHAGDGSGRLFITQQTGQIVIFDGTEVLPTPFLDIHSLVSCCGEQGLLSVAFHPHYKSNGLFYVNYTRAGDGATIVARYTVSTGDADVADPDSAVILLTIPQPFPNHNGGQLQFGPDGYLYIGMGDGGSGGDPQNNAQTLNTLLGKMLRIDVDSGSPYASPPTNPFVETPDDPSTRGEIWAYGLRNPWRFSFDRVTGDLFIGDVGQGDWEEVDFQPAGSTGGENYGWRLMEGNHCFNPSSNCNDGTLALPILEYSHSQGCAITGGYRYRGSQLPQFYGTYFYGDFCSGRIWGATQNGDGSWTSSQILGTSYSISTFGEGEDGELYFADYGGGAIYRIISDTTPFSLSITTSGLGSGTVTSAPPGIDCPVTCATSFIVGTVVILTPQPDPGSAFGGWSGDPGCSNAAVTMNTNKNCTATFIKGPDLTGQITQITRSSKRGSDELKFVMTVQNVGGAPLAGNCVVQFYISANPTLDAGATPLSMQAVQPKKLVPGGAVSVKVKIKVPSPSQGKYLIAVIDAGNAIPEWDETNNLAVQQIL